MLTEKNIELLDKFLTDNWPSRIAVVGAPRSGKSEIALHISDHMGIPHNETDKYLQISNKEIRDVQIDMFLKGTRTYVCSGMSLPKIMRRHARADEAWIDALVVTHVNEDTMAKSYADDPEKLKGALANAKAQQTILAEWREMMKSIDITVLEFDVQMDYD